MSSSGSLEAGIVNYKTCSEGHSGDALNFPRTALGVCIHLWTIQSLLAPAECLMAIPCHRKRKAETEELWFTGETVEKSLWGPEIPEAWVDQLYPDIQDPMLQQCTFSSLARGTLVLSLFHNMIACSAPWIDYCRKLTV
ncbi:hypothetical protein STEG23_034230, partial [Scotinomys teguina]